MKVLNVHAAITTAVGYGTAERTHQLSRYLAKNNVDCRVLTLHFGPLAPEASAELQDVTLIELPCLLKRFFIPRVSLKKLYAIVAEADMVHLMGHWTALNALVYYVARRLQKPYVFCPAGALAIYGRSKIMKALYQTFIGKKMCQHAEQMIAITQDEVTLFQNYGIPLEKITLVPNGIAEENLSLPPAEKKHPYGDRYLLFMGRLNPIKGPDLLLKAFIQLAAAFPDYHLVFAGPDNGMLASLQQEVEVQHLSSRVHFVGYVTGKEKTRLYQEAALLVIPSRHEAMSIVVLEAGILGKAILMTDACGFPEVESIGGGVITPATVDGLAQGLRSLLENSANLSSMGERLKQYVEAHYTWDHQVKKMIALYRRLLRAT